MKCLIELMGKLSSRKKDAQDALERTRDDDSIIALGERINVLNEVITVVEHMIDSTLDAMED